jgi:hypothetical protein
VFVFLINDEGGGDNDARKDDERNGNIASL